MTDEQWTKEFAKKLRRKMDICGVNQKRTIRIIRSIRSYDQSISYRRVSSEIFKCNKNRKSVKRKYIRT